MASLGATANVYGLIFAARDDDDLEGLGVILINPFKPSEGGKPRSATRTS